MPTDMHKYGVFIASYIWTVCQLEGGVRQMSNNSQEPSKYEVQTTKLNKMPVPDKQREEFAEDMVEDAKEAFSQQQSEGQE